MKRIDTQAQSIIDAPELQSALNTLFDGQLNSAKCKPSISGACLELRLSGLHWFTSFGDVDYMVDEIIESLNPTNEFVFYPRETTIDYEFARNGANNRPERTGDVIVNIFFQVD